MLKAEADEALSLLWRAVDAAGFDAISASAGQVTVRVRPFPALWKRRRTIELTGTFDSSPLGTEIRWDILGLNGAELDTLTTIEQYLPEGSFHDHGITDALAEANLDLTGTTSARVIASVLHPVETVRALGMGHLDHTAGILALTGRRLLFLPQDEPLGEPLIDPYLSAIETITLGKKRTGETLTIRLGHGSHVITHLGHGEGYNVARTFREIIDPD